MLVLSANVHTILLGVSLHLNREPSITRLTMYKRRGKNNTLTPFAVTSHGDCLFRLDCVFTAVYLHNQFRLVDFAEDYADYLQTCKRVSANIRTELTVVSAAFAGPKLIADSG